MGLRAVFLDVGDTLLRERIPRPAIYAARARARGIAVGDARMRELMVETHRDLPEVLAGSYRYSDPWFQAFIRRIFVERLGLAPGELPALERELFAHFEDPRSFGAFPEAEALFARVRRADLVLGVISNWSARLPLLLAHLGWLRHFDFVLCSALVGLEKPDPRIYERALARARVAPGEALHAGNHPREDGGARLAGLRAVLVDHDGRLQDDSLPRVRDLAELGTYIEGLRA